jgi:hypothetical protein
MSAPMYSPGPWAAKMRKHWNDDAAYFDGVVGPDGERIRVDGLVLTSGAVAQANARLIAAAPELLSLLQDWLTSFADTLEGGDDEIVTFTRAAIARATGDTP